MAKVSKTRKKLLRAFLNNRAQQKQEPTKKQQYMEAQNRIMRSKMKLARKKGLQKQLRFNEEIEKVINQPIPNPVQEIILKPIDNGEEFLNYNQNPSQPIKPENSNELPNTNPE